jgi:hypothetical protein
MTMRGEIEDIADNLRRLASSLRSGSRDPEQVASKLKNIADELEGLALKLKSTN